MLGPHIIAGVSRHLDLLRRWQPKTVLVLDPNVDEIRALKAACPKTIVIGRIYVPDSEMDWRIKNSPAQAAAFAHNLVMNNPARGVVDYWQVANEVCQFWDTLPKLVEFERQRMIFANSAGYKCGILAFSVGQPDMPVNNRMAFWQLTYPALDLATSTGHIVVLHQYGWPDLWGPDASWYIHRLEHQVLPRLPEKYKALKFAVTEFGVDGRLVGIENGWNGYVSAERYALDLINIGKYLEQAKDRVLGYNIFTLGHYAPWGSYDILGSVAERLAEHYSSANHLPVPTPAIVESGMTKIYDVNGAEKSEAWLKEKFGVVVARADKSEKRFALTEIQVTEGPATLIVIARDKTGVPLNSHAVAFYWPDAPTNLMTKDGDVFQTRFKGRANVQWTDANGMTGYGLGMGSYIYDPKVGGPHAVWILHNLYESDALDKFGMLAGTNHVGPLRLTFSLVDAEVEAPSFDTIQDAIRYEAEENDVLSVNPDAALCKVAQAKGLWPTSNEFELAFDGVVYTAQRFRDPKSNAVYVLYCKKGEWYRVMEIVY